MSSLVRSRRDSEYFPLFRSLFDDFWTNDLVRPAAIGTTVPAVNVAEALKHYEIDMAVPGKKKADFKIEVDANKVLTISSQSEEKKTETDEKKVTREEYSFSSFSRSFTLPKDADSEKVSASYEDGVLKIFVPKMEDKPAPKAKSIDIS